VYVGLDISMMIIAALLMSIVAHVSVCKCECKFERTPATKKRGPYKKTISRN
jgi:hypothetical protein